VPSAIRCRFNQWWRQGAVNSARRTIKSQSRNKPRGGDRIAGDSTHLRARPRETPSKEERLLMTGSNAVIDG